MKTKTVETRNYIITNNRKWVKINYNGEITFVKGGIGRRIYTNRSKQNIYENT